MRQILSKILVFIRSLGLKNQETKIEAIAANVFNLLLIPLFFIHVCVFFVLELSMHYIGGIKTWGLVI